MMNEDAKDIQFKERVALQLANAVPESIFEKARELKVPNWQKKSANELKFYIIKSLTEEYKQKERELQEDIVRRQTLGAAMLHNKE
jgi:hypothetical protein